MLRTLAFGITVMATKFAFCPADLDDESWKLLDDTLERFEQAWQTTPSPEMVDFVPPPARGLREGAKETTVQSPLSPPGRGQGEGVKKPSVLSSEALTTLRSADDEVYAGPQWFPNGKGIVYSAKTGQFHHIYTLKLEDKNAVRLTTGEYNDIEPDVATRLRPSTTGI